MIVVARTSKAMLNNSVESGHSCPVLDHMKKSIQCWFSTNVLDQTVESPLYSYFAWFLFVCYFNLSWKGIGLCFFWVFFLGGGY